jgi:hypothetical protein
VSAKQAQKRAFACPIRPSDDREPRVKAEFNFRELTPAIYFKTLKLVHASPLPERATSSTADNVRKAALPHPAQASHFGKLN